MSAAVAPAQAGGRTSSGFQAGPPQLVVSGTYYGDVGTAGANRTYDISPDGRRFLMLKAATPNEVDDPFAGLTQVHIEQNWFEELKARVPTGQ